MSLPNFGPSGWYDISSAAQNMVLSTNYSALSNLQLAGAAQGLGSYYNAYQGQMSQLAGYPQPQTVQYVTSSFSDFMQQVAAPAKAVKKRILEKLRSEIDDWHGDVLCRAA